jgi:hypothetical protein
MSTLDRLRDIVKTSRSVPIVAPESRNERSRLEGDGISRRLDSAHDIARAAIILGGAVVERSEGAVIVVDREYRSNALHGRLPIADVVSVVTEGTDAL